ncbi:hypothetical protein GCM10029978_067850 [Actinoallomurus acanthiterrae]
MTAPLLERNHVPDPLVFDGGRFIVRGERGAIEHSPRATLLHPTSSDRTLERCEWLETPCTLDWLTREQHAQVRAVLYRGGENALWTHLEKLYLEKFRSTQAVGTR